MLENRMSDQLSWGHNQGLLPPGQGSVSLVTLGGVLVIKQSPFQLSLLALENGQEGPGP